MLLWILIIVLLLGWGGAYWGPWNYRGNSLIHVVLLIVLVLVVVQLLGYGPRGRWPW